MEVQESVWAFMQKRLGYNDEEMKKFREDPKNAHVLSKAPELMNKTIVAEVVQSHGCNSEHKVGDKFYLDGAGNLLAHLCPKRMCIYALGCIGPAVLTMNELIYAGVNPNDMKFNRVGCPDVGVQCGGWGRVVMEVRTEDRA